MNVTCGFLVEYSRAIRATITHVSIVGFIFTYIYPGFIDVEGVRVDGWALKIGDFLVHHLPCMLFWVYYDRYLMSGVHGTEVNPASSIQHGRGHAVTASLELAAAGAADRAEGAMQNVPGRPLATEIAERSPFWNFWFYVAYRVYIRAINVNAAHLYGLEIGMLYFTYAVCLFL